MEEEFRTCFKTSLLFALSTAFSCFPCPGLYPRRVASTGCFQAPLCFQIALISLLIDKFLFLPSLSLPSFPTFLSFSSYLPSFLSFFFPLAAFSPSETGGWQEGWYNRLSSLVLALSLSWLKLPMDSPV